MSHAILTTTECSFFFFLKRTFWILFSPYHMRPVLKSPLKQLKSVLKNIPNSIGTSKSAFSSTCVDDTSDSIGTSSGISLQSTQMHFSSGGPDREAQSLCTHLRKTSNKLKICKETNESQFICYVMANTA